MEESSHWEQSGFVPERLLYNGAGHVGDEVPRGEARVLEQVDGAHVDAVPVVVSENGDDARARRPIKAVAVGDVTIGAASDAAEDAVH